MGSILYAVECPQCGCPAIEDNHYKTDEIYIHCRRCGYNYSKVLRFDSDDTLEYDEEVCKGYGVFCLVKKVGQGRFVLLNDPLTEEYAGVSKRVGILNTDSNSIPFLYRQLDPIIPLLNTHFGNFRLFVYIAHKMQFYLIILNYLPGFDTLAARVFIY
ncbi:hypothetical protein [Lentibacillus sp. CBA3610]|uniref:hypothetical protein n=1 Tax=Lentibacillus sp. CBA3610 TaxID=2518176 RepID=UPI0015961763|nr:hypothetical protein [Lentibacillus sp. CBA3610]QKY70779.1 hypothetical protein Len3610_15385 [Lentibacillus sp. CBA3610]